MGAAKAVLRGLVRALNKYMSQKNKRDRKQAKYSTQGGKGNRAPKK